MPRKTDIRLVFQRRLKEVRLECQMSQRELGVSAGLDPLVAATRVNRYEKGVHEPDLATVGRLAEALNVPAAYLLADDERLARVILAFDRLPVAEKDQILKALENT